MFFLKEYAFRQRIDIVKDDIDINHNRFLQIPEAAQMSNSMRSSSKAKKSMDKASSIIISVCLIILTGLVIHWLRGKSGGTVLGRVGAIVNAMLFALLGIRFVPMWVRSWSKTDMAADNAGACNSDSSGELDKPVSRAVLAKIFFTFLLVDIFIILLMYILQILSGNMKPFSEAVNLWRATDSASYLTIAESWYASTGEWDRLVQLVFLPGYPITIRTVNLLIGNYLLSAMLVSALAFAGAGTVMYRLVRLDYSHETAIRALKYLCLLPGAFFFASPMTESLFLLLSVSCLYCLRRKNWLAACILGGMASFTRSVGLVLFVPAIFEMISHDVRMSSSAEGLSKSNTGIRKFAKYACLPIIFLGFGGYLLINYQVSGNPLQFMIYQREHWSQSMGFFFNTVSYQTDYAVRCVEEMEHNNLIGLWLPNLFCIFTGLIIMLPAVKKLRPSYTAYFLIYYIITIGATWLLSAPRYLTVLVPLPIALAVIAEKRRTDDILTLAYELLYLVYSYAFVNRWNVW